MKLSFTVALLTLLGTSPALADKEWSTTSYEIWGADQSNTVPGQEALGVAGSFLWIWDSEDLQKVIATDNATATSRTGQMPTPKSCAPNQDAGPCDLFTIFPKELTDAVSGESLADAAGFGRWHGVTKDPQNKYVTANIFAPGGGYLGIVDASTKEAVGLFRVTEMTYATSGEATATTRNVHMSFWNGDGSAILIHNLAGKALERINVERDDMGKITGLAFDKSATVGMGKNMTVASEASYFEGENAFGRSLVGGVVGSYEDADLGDTTPTGACKENGCTGGMDAGRPNNLPICPVMATDNGLVFNTLAGGGLLVVESTKTPMMIVGAYGNDKIHGAGVCGSQVSDKVYVTSGASASGAGATQSMFALYAFDPTLYTATDYEKNMPEPTVVFDDDTGTATGGKVVGDAENESGQLPGYTTRRDAHDLVGTMDQKYVHVVDRLQNVVEVFDATTDEIVGTYDLTTATGMPGDGTVGPCSAVSVTDGGDDFPINDPAPDFIDATPDGKYMVLSFRGPSPVSAGHAAQGSCPGVGIVELLEGGKTGKLVGVLRTTNTMADLVGDVSPAGGALYAGAERSDIHDAVVVFSPPEKEEGEGADPGQGGTTGEDEVMSDDASSSTHVSWVFSVAVMCFMMLIQ